MLITPDFVFLHLPKTGGTFVATTLKQVYRSRLPSRPVSLMRKAVLARPQLLESSAVATAAVRLLGCVSLRKHGTAREIPAGASGTPVVSIVRNPLDRYVSIYHAAGWREQASPSWVDAVQARFPHFPDLSFPEFLELSPHFALGLSKAFIESPPSSGFLTRSFTYFYSPKLIIDGEVEHDLTASEIRRSIVDCHFLHMEQLNAELAVFLESLGHGLDVVDSVRTADKILPKTPRRPDRTWEAYYTPAMVNDVVRREHALFELFPEYLPDGWGPSKGGGVSPTERTR